MTSTPSTADRHVELSFMIGTFVTDHLIRLYQAFDGDLVGALVLATIANRSLQRYYEDVARRSPQGLDQLIAEDQHLPHLRHCNAYSVSSATGIPRETVRRKVRWLEERGWITVGARGELALARHISRRFRNFDATTNERFERVAREALAVIDGPGAAR